MVEQISKAVISSMVDKNAVDPAEREIYQEIIFSSLASFASAMVVGFLLGKPLPMFIFLTSFALMRMYSGGYHAKSYRTCFVESICISVVVQFVLYLVDRFPSIAAIEITFALSYISLVIIFVLAPVENSHAPLSEHETNRYRIVSRWICIGEVTIILAGIIALTPNSFVWPITLGLFFSSALVLAGHWIQVGVGGVTR
jgi:accessory gene regulator B